MFRRACWVASLESCGANSPVVSFQFPVIVSRVGSISLSRFTVRATSGATTGGSELMAAAATVAGAGTAAGAGAGAGAGATVTVGGLAATAAVPERFMMTMTPMMMATATAPTEAQRRMLRREVSGDPLAM